MFIVGCNSDSSGSKETEQLDNDHDPTAIEYPRGQEPQPSETTGQIDDKGEFVVIQDFDQSSWPEMRKSFNLNEISNAAESQITSNAVGASAWKPWGEYQYRVIYFSEGGALKAKPQLRGRDNEEFGFSTQLIDSLNMEQLWIEIQRSSIKISQSHK